MRIVFAIIFVLFATNLYAGKPVPTGQTEITECQVIDTPGSFKLGANLPGSAGLLGNDCITIATDWVTVDLAGFLIQGNGAGNAVDDNDTGYIGITIRNGTVQGFGEGIHLSRGTEAFVERIRAIDNLSIGINVGPNSVLLYNLATNNNVGIQADCPTNAIGNSAWSNVLHNFNFLSPEDCTETTNLNTFDIASCGEDLNDSCLVGVGTCQRAGIMVCNSDFSGTQCGATPGTPGVETCNRFDDDCDDLVDEGFPNLGVPCTVGIGACSGAGVQVCTSDGTTVECNASPGTPTPESCNGIDDDCDGSTDEDFADLGTFCTVGVGACVSGGVNVCSVDETAAECNAIPGTPASESCNGIDDDCDGQTDEDFYLDSDVNNCGYCGFACPDVPNAAPTCDTGSCGYACETGYYECDENPSNGCESPSQCG